MSSGLNGRRSRGSFSPDQRIEAPPSRAIKENEQEDEAVKDRGFSMIHDWIKAAFGVDHKICHGHFAARNESGDAREQTNRDQQTADQFNPSAEVHDSSAGAMTAGWKTEKLLTAMRSVEKTYD
jgi:hypothetical protein